MVQQLHTFLTELDRSEWSTSHCGRSVTGEVHLSNHWTGGWVGSRAGLDAVAKKKFLPVPKTKPSRPARSRLWTTQAPDDH
jgi:hypothetical protein